MTSLHLLLTFAFFGASLSTPQDPEIQSYALNPAEINTLYADSDVLNPLRDVAPQPIIKPNLEDTIKEVEALINGNPKLPRLTRGEIIEIVENITRTEKKTREDGKRALMVVMPFTAGSAQGDDIRELYTRTPVTRIIGEVDPKDKVQKKVRKPPRKWPLFPEINIENEIIEENKNNVPRFQYLPKTTTTTTTTQRITKKIPSTTVRSIIHQPITTFKPKYTWTTSKPVEITEQTTVLSPVYTTSPKPKPTRKVKPQKFVNHKYAEDTQTNGMRIISPPVFTPMRDDGYSAPYTISLKQPHLQPQVTIEEVKITPDMYGDMPKYKSKKPQNAIHLTTSERTVFDDKAYPDQHKPQNVINLTTPQRTVLDDKAYLDQYKPQNVIHLTTSERSVLDDISIPEQYKGVIKGLDLIITPENKTPQTKQVMKQVNPQNVYKRASTTIMPDISNVADNLSPDMKELLMSFGLINKPTLKQQDITTEHIPYAQSADVNPNSYASFKPLPNNAPTRNDMDEFLSGFGLGRNSFRSQKSISMDKPKKVAAKPSELDLEAVPDHLKNVVYNMGFTTKNIRDIQKEKQHVFKPNDHISDEAELKKLSKLLDMIKDLEKMNGNITKENLKDFDTKTLKELIGNLNGNTFVPLNEQDAPNPDNLEYTLVKNGVKREENTTPEVITTRSEEVITTRSEEVITPKSEEVITTKSEEAITTRSEEDITTVVYATPDDSNSGSLEDLEASFGGGTVGKPITAEDVSTTTVRTPENENTDSKSTSLEDLEASFGAMVETPITTEAPTTTTTIRTGFYYLVDWNTFWEMDNQNGRRLNLRFQPHAGNPRYFQSVTVP